MNNEDMTQNYGFAYKDCDGKTYKQEIESGGMTWSECLNDYVRFLETVFGYPIMDQVRIEQPAYLYQMMDTFPDYLDPWTGEYFIKEGEDK